MIFLVVTFEKGEEKGLNSSFEGDCGFEKLS